MCGLNGVFYMSSVRVCDTLLRLDSARDSADSVARFLASLLRSKHQYNIAGLLTNKARTWWNFEFSAVIRSIFGRSLSVGFSTLFELLGFKYRYSRFAYYECQKRLRGY